MKKQLLKSEKDLYALLDNIYRIIPDDEANKAIYQSKEEQYEYQLTFDLPPQYPCVMIYETFHYNHSSYKPHLNNREYTDIRNVIYVTTEDFTIKK
jgi:hypothetical protein